MIELFEDGGGRCGPDEGLGRFVVRLDVARDGVFELGNGFEDAASDSSARDRREKPFDGVEPGGGRRGEVEGPSWMRGEPFQDIGMFVRGVIVDDGVNELAAWHGAVHGGEKSDELLMPMLVHATPDHGSVEDVQGGKECGRAVAFVIMGHGPALARLQRQARLGPIESLNLALLVDGDDHGVSWRVHIETDDVLDLLGEFRIVGALEGAKPMRLQAIGLPQTLDGAQRDADRLGHGAAGRQTRTSRKICESFVSVPALV